jgi:hypothetical protein
MSTNELIGSAVVAAFVSGVVSIAGALISNRTSASINREKIAADGELADRRFRYDREMHDYKRRTELGEDVLASFYEFRDIMRSVRNPGSSGNEGDTRERAPGESPDLARSRDLYFIPFERLNNHAQFLGALFSKRYRARALFGENIEKAFSQAHQAMVWVRVSASMLMRTAGNPPNFEQHNRWEGDIWEGFAEQDRVALAIDKAVILAESAIEPSLSSQPSGD